MAEKTLKNKILMILKQNTYNLEEISTSLSIKEDIVASKLSELLQRDLIKLTSSMTYTIKENKEISIRLRMNKSQKSKWVNFVNKNDSFSNLSGLIRYCVNGFIDGELQATNQNTIASITLKSKEAELNAQQIALNEKLEAMEKHILKLSNQQTTKESLQLKNRILKQLKKAWYSMEEISDVLEIDESIIADELANLLKAAAIKFNSSMEYTVKRAD